MERRAVAPLLDVDGVAAGEVPPTYWRGRARLVRGAPAAPVTASRERAAATISTVLLCRLECTELVLRVLNDALKPLIGSYTRACGASARGSTPAQWLLLCGVLTLQRGWDIMESTQID